MIDFIDVRDGMILICEGLKCVGGGNDAESIAHSIKRRGGPASEIYRSGSCDFADEYGFESQKAFEDLWGDVCELL
jgi:hypothetical protein